MMKSSSAVDIVMVQQQNATLAAWKEVAWNVTLQQMQEQATSHRMQREQSQQARRALAETTKQFKKSVRTAEQAVAAENSSCSGGDAAAAAATAVQQSVTALAALCKVTIKAYQQEIDNLTVRCKASEQAYAGMTQALQELPDPAVVLAENQKVFESQEAQMSQLLETVENLNQELQASQETNEKYQQEIQALREAAPKESGLSDEERAELVQLRTEVAEYEVEFRSLKNQDVTIRKLQDKIKELQVEGAESLEKSIAQAKEELAATEGRRAAEALEREAAMERKLRSLELQLQAERAGREATESVVLDQDEGLSRREAAWEAQRKILLDDNNRIREAFQTVSRERDELKMKLSALHDETPVSGGDTTTPRSMSQRTPPSSSAGGGPSVQDLMLERNAYEAEVAEISETNSVLREELRLKEESATEERRALESRIDTLQRETTSLNAELLSVRSQLSSAPSQAVVENMKRELRILKRLEYNADDTAPEIAGEVDEETDLEAVLVAKLRRAESELVTERTSRADLVKETAELKKALEEAEHSKRESDRLVASLEKDLEHAIASSTSHSAIKSQHPRSKSEVITTKENPETLRSILEPSAGSGTPTPTPPLLAPTPKEASAKEKADDDHSVATIVMAQRDRLRARCDALERERDSFKRELQAQVQASESLKSDNTKLYEKVRYLQNYKNPPSSSGPYSRSSSMTDRDLDLETLEQRYEASVDPFKQFSKNERQRKLAEMSPMERTVFVVAKTVLSTKEMRTGLFFYVLTLHLLVFVTTYHWSHAGNTCTFANEHLAHLPPALPQHIQQQMIAKDADAAEGLHL